MSFKITANLSDLKRLQKAISDKIMQKAVSRSLKRTAVTVKKEAAKLIREKIRLPVGEIKESIKTIERASPSTHIDSQEIRFEIKNKRISLRKFSPRQTRQGVSVNVTGKRTIYRHAFLAIMPNAPEQQVMVRKRVLDKGIKPRRHYIAKRHGRDAGYQSGAELPILKKTERSPLKAFEGIEEKLRPIAEEKLQKEIIQNLQYYISKAEG